MPPCQLLIYAAMFFAQGYDGRFWGTRVWEFTDKQTNKRASRGSIRIWLELRHLTAPPSYGSYVYRRPTP